jgi:hypothetical protein
VIALAGALLFITLHYFSQLTVLASTQVKFLELPTLAILAFLTLWSVTTLIFKLIREGILLVFSIQAHPVIDRWGGAFLSALRGVIVASMVFYMLLLSYNPVSIKMARSSVSRIAVSSLATGIYAGIHKNLVVKFFPEEKISEEALLVPQFLEDKRFK